MRCQHEAPNHVAAQVQSFFDGIGPACDCASQGIALAAWEIMNEPGSVDPTTVDDTNPCFDTKTVLGASGAGWAGHHATMKELLAFFNRHAAAIHAADPKALVTVGSWSQRASTDARVGKFGTKFFNYYKDDCLVAAGGHSAPGGALDFFQVHSYANARDGLFDAGSPFGKNVESIKAYGLKKPMVVGEFSAGSTKGKRRIDELYSSVLEKGFAGAWDWSLLGGDGNDDETIADLGMRSLRQDPRTHVHIVSATGAGSKNRPVHGEAEDNVALDTCSCSDQAPSCYPCQQAGREMPACS